MQNNNARVDEVGRDEKGNIIHRVILEGKQPEFMVKCTGNWKSYQDHPNVDFDGDDKLVIGNEMKSKLGLPGPEGNFQFPTVWGHGNVLLCSESLDLPIQEAWNNFYLEDRPRGYKTLANNLVAIFGLLGFDKSSTLIDISPKFLEKFSNQDYGVLARVIEWVNHDPSEEVIGQAIADLDRMVNFMMFGPEPELEGNMLGGLNKKWLEWYQAVNPVSLREAKEEGDKRLLLKRPKVEEVPEEKGPELLTPEGGRNPEWVRWYRDLKGCLLREALDECNRRIKELNKQ